ncbi:hypothetical protein ACVMAJ_003884 [Bradyrhizobium sp. USDA 4448]
MACGGRRSIPQWATQFVAILSDQRESLTRLREGRWGPPAGKQETHW